MSTSQFIAGNKTAALYTIPSMEADLLIPDLDELDAVNDDETSTSTEESYDMADFTLYM